MTARRPARRPSRTRAVGYLLEGDHDEAETERLLESARRAGVVAQYDTGRGRVVWFSGPPGREMRLLRERVRGMIGAGSQRARR